MFDTHIFVIGCSSLERTLTFIYRRRPNIYFNITSPTPGTFIIALHYKGREKAILEMDLKIDDLLEKVRVLLHYPRVPPGCPLASADVA